jgi:hypothetical protein
MQYASVRVLTALFLILCSTAVWSQTESTSTYAKVTSNQVSLETGLIKGYFKDLNFAQLNYNESGALLSLTYLRQNPDGNRIFAADIDFANGKIKSDVGEFFDARHTLGNVELSFLWRLRQLKKTNLSFFLGPQYNSFIQYVDWNDQEAWTYLAAHGLNIKGFVRYKGSGRRSFETSISIPVVLVFVRPPYNGYDLFIQENSENLLKIAFRGELASFNKYFAVDWKTIYRYAASNHLDFIFGFLFRYQGVSGYNKIRHFQNQLTVGFAIKF